MLTPGTKLMLTYDHLIVSLQSISTKNLDGIVRSYNQISMVMINTLLPLSLDQYTSMYAVLSLLPLCISAAG